MPRPFLKDLEMKIEKLRNPYVRGNEGCSVSMIDLLEKINEIIDAMNGEHDPADIYSEDGRLIAKKDESEDERIRKWLVDYFSSIKETVWIHRDITCEQILEWLEKQKPMYNLEIPSGDVAPAEEDGPFDEDDFLENELSAFLQNYDKEYDDDAAVSDVARHFYEIGKKQKEQMPAEENKDQRHIYFMIEDGRRCGVIEGRKQVIDNPEKYGLQKTAGWSEEDEFFRQQLIVYCEKGIQDPLAAKCVDWLKSLRPSWKPSEEQLNCLCAAVDAAIRKHNESVSGYKPARVLKSLYEQLKKL